MPTATYETVLEMAESLATNDKLRLVEDLTRKALTPDSSFTIVAPVVVARKHSIMELEGLGKEIWQGIDATEYVRELRAEWD